MKTSKSVFAALVTLLPISWTGCIPGITWLPDSSGFVYPAGKDGGRLMLFDLAKKSPQTLVADTKCKTLWPAVSPDGKRIAVGQLAHEKKNTLQVLIYDLKGNVTQRSSIFSISEVTNADNSRELNPTELFWAPNNKIVISASTEAGAVAIYDVKTDRIVVVPGAKAAVFGAKPFPNDGKGFLINKGTKNALAFSFVDWEGHEKPVALNFPGKVSDEIQGMLFCTFACSSSWQGNKAIVSTSRARCEIETDKLVGNGRLISPDEPNSENSVWQEFAFPNGSYVLQVVEWTKRVRQDSEEKLCRLEIFDTRQKKTKTLREHPRRPILFPSPNGKHVAVRWLDDGLDGREVQLFWVIDQNGKIVANFKDPQ